jgi:acetyl-CoA/propionyl-CoA carboxylase carboxyl transferase subunit
MDLVTAPSPVPRTPAARIGTEPVPESPVGRMESLVDPGTLRVRGGEECGVITGSGRVDGGRVHVFASDPARQGGALGTAECATIVGTITRAVRDRSPVVGLWHSGGARLQEDPVCLHAVGSVFAAMVAASGRVPQLSVVLGPAAGGAAYGPALSDIIIMGPAGRIFVTGPEVVRAATGQDIDADGLGGPLMHSRRSGVAHLVTDSDSAAITATRRLAALLATGTGPARGRQDVADVLPDDPGIAAVLPESPRRAYDVHPLLERLVDEPDGTGTQTVRLTELHASWARNMVTAFGRLAGRPVGVVANNPLHRCGCLDAVSGDKAARFVRLCDALAVPILVVVDVPGYLPGTAQEWDGVVRRGAKLLHAFAEAQVPRVTVITRKAFGGAFVAMNSRALGATAAFAWPGATVGVMDPRAAVGVIHRRRLREVPPSERRAVLEELAVVHQRQTGGVQGAVRAGLLDAVVDPPATRRVVAGVLAGEPCRQGRHRNIPL